jgi:hypothetical protein
MAFPWHIAVTPKNVVGSFGRAGRVVQWDMEHELLLAIIAPELAAPAEETLLHERIDAETEDEIALVRTSAISKWIWNEGWNKS